MASGMEVDGDPLPVLDSNVGSLKRCNSAPMINMLEDGAPITSRNNQKQSQDDTCKPALSSPNLLVLSSLSNSSSFRPFDSSKSRVRHNSTSSLLQPTHSCNNVSTPIKVQNRIHQIKREEEVHRNSYREITHEREVQSTIQMTQSWGEQLNLEDPPPPLELGHKARPRSLSESLHIFTSGFPVSSSPSPTRVGKQCFSPSMGAPVIFGNSFNFTPSPSPSPTRRVTRRSLSPIVTLKPSSLSHKRKLDADSDSGFSQPKRLLLAPASLSIPPQGNHLMQQAHQNSLRGLDNLRQHTHSSLSTGSFDDSASEHSSVGTITSSATSVVMPFGFTPLLPDNCSNTTDSESEMSEPLHQNNNTISHDHNNR